MTAGENVDDWLHAGAVDPRIVEALRVLVAAEALTTTEEVMAFLDHPSRWSREIRGWYDRGKPWPPAYSTVDYRSPLPHLNGTADSGWDLFTRWLTRLEKDENESS